MGGSCLFVCACPRLFYVCSSIAQFLSAVSVSGCFGAVHECSVVQDAFRCGAWVFSGASVVSFRFPISATIFVFFVALLWVIVDAVCGWCNFLCVFVHRSFVTCFCEARFFEQLFATEILHGMFGCLRGARVFEIVLHIYFCGARIFRLLPFV